MKIKETILGFAVMMCICTLYSCSKDDPQNNTYLVTVAPQRIVSVYNNATSATPNLLPTYDGESVSVTICNTRHDVEQAFTEQFLAANPEYLSVDFNTNTLIVATASLDRERSIESAALQYVISDGQNLFDVNKAWLILMLNNGDTGNVIAPPSQTASLSTVRVAYAFPKIPSEWNIAPVVK